MQNASHIVGTQQQVIAFIMLDVLQKLDFYIAYNDDLKSNK